jgi:farnesyl-diphosphate farnesyltransferase
MGGADELGGKLLEGVSRSFYLTLKALPQGLREPLSLAYLLARAADTIADTATVEDCIRLECLRELDRIMQSETTSLDAEGQLCERLKQEFVPQQLDADEAILLERLPEALSAFHQAPEPQQRAMRGVMNPIVRGQILDIERFPTDGELRAMPDATALDEYTWLVAGCVGEFWTKLCIEEVPDCFDHQVSRESLVSWGIRYGKGLQLVNILRDVSKDRRLGRCYLPNTELLAHGLTLEEIESTPAKLLPLLKPWQTKCREHLLCGIDYLDAIQSKRVLYATSLPLLLGLKTLTLIEQADGTTLLQGVKVSRAEVSKVLFDAGVASLRRGGIRRLAEKLIG